MNNRLKCGQVMTLKIFWDSTANVLEPAKRSSCINLSYQYFDVTVIQFESSILELNHILLELVISCFLTPWKCHFHLWNWKRASYLDKNQPQNAEIKSLFVSWKFVIIFWSSIRELLDTCIRIFADLQQTFLHFFGSTSWIVSAFK